MKPAPNSGDGLVRSLCFSYSLVQGFALQFSTNLSLNEASADSAEPVREMPPVNATGGFAQAMSNVASGLRPTAHESFQASEASRKPWPKPLNRAS